MYNLRVLIHDKMIVLALVHLIVFHPTGYNSDGVLSEGQRSNFSESLLKLYNTHKSGKLLSWRPKSMPIQFGTSGVETYKLILL